MQNLAYEAFFAPLKGRQTPVMTLADGQTLSGQAFLDQVTACRRVFDRMGVRPADRVAVQVGKSATALALYGACLAAGAVLVPLNPAYTPTEVDYFLGNATPRLLVCDPASKTALTPLATAVGAGVLTLDGLGQGSMADSMARAQAGAAPDPVARGAGDLAAILYTSGTTGRSKGAMLTHGNLVSNARALADLWQFTPDDVLLHALPVFHTHGLFVASNVSLLTGGRMIFLPGFDPDQVFRHLPAATVFMGVPTFYIRLLDDSRLNRQAAAGMRLFVSGSAPLLAETHRSFHDRTGHMILERYGMTETNMNTSNPYAGDRRAGTVGLPLPGVEVRVMDGAVPAAPNTPGMVEVRGPNVFAGYWGMPDKTAEDLRPDGWFTTGDLGLFDDAGYLVIVGRAKDMVISGGFNIYPAEVEAALDAVPGVLESAVIGLPHPDLGEAAFAVLVAQKGTNLQAPAVLAALHDRLARFKQPRAAAVVHALPRNAMGKVQKALLRQTYAGWFRP